MLRYKTYLFTLLFAALYLAAGAQKKQADKLYAKAEYYKAIPKYEKALHGGDVKSKQESLLKLADSYRILNNYSKAAENYKQAIALGAVPAQVYYDYGTVLKSLNRYNEAVANFNSYIAQNPDDKKVAAAIKFCSEIAYWQSKPQEYTLSDLDMVNTSRSEFCPALINHTLIYTGEQQSDYIEYTTNNLNGQPYLNVLYSTVAGSTFKKGKSLSKKVNTDYHDGPASFSADGKTMYLTRVSYKVNKRVKNFVNKAKLYTLTGHDKKWGKLQPFAYNNDDYSCAHASVSNDGTLLFFTSDMPGGFGGKDIWMCKKNAGSWDKPVNLGPDINTSGDELFPYIKKNGVLFFSSNGLPGYGGTDIFSAKYKNGVWLLNRNEGLALNSTADDFGITFITDSTGYVSSNREGGKGKDDIYAFTYTNKYINVDGTILLTENRNNPAKDLKLFLLNEKSQIIDSTLTNEKGYFIFKDLESDKTYMAQIVENEFNLKNKSRYYMADKNGELVRVTHNGGKGLKFVFKNLPLDVNGLPDMYNDDDLNLAGNILFGENPAKAVVNKVITITNTSGDVLEKTTTNEFGAFVFRNLPVDQDYMITVEGDDLSLDTKITLTNKTGKEVKVLRLKGKGSFNFSLLSVDKSVLEDLSIGDEDMIMALKGFMLDQDKKPIANASITITDKDKVTQTITTDDKGKFEFKNLSADKNYLFSFDDTENKFTGVSKIYLADSKGKIYKEVARNKNNRYDYQLLDVDKSILGDFTVDDPWLQALNMNNKQTMTITENLIYAYGDYKIDDAGKNILDKVVSVLKSNTDLNIELSSHTDSRSSDSYNLALSQKRAKSAVDYIISKGIDKSRLKAIGYGETRLLNKCDNTTPCTEEEHAVNRRTEFKIVENKKL